MPDFAPPYTPRMRLSYNVGGRPHKMQLRVARGGEDDFPTLLEVFSDLLGALDSNLWSDWTLIANEVATTDSTIFLPTSLPVAPSPGVSTSSRVLSDNAVEVRFQGRSTGGLKTSISVYGVAKNPSASADSRDFRILATEDSTIAGAVAVLNGAGVIVANDSNAVVWKPYANISYNAYWKRKIRNGG